MISSPRWAGRQCSTIASASALRAAPALTWNGAEQADPVEPVVLLAHRRPGVGDEHVGAVDRRLRVGGDRDGGAGLGGPLLARPSTNRGSGSKPAGAAIVTCMPAVTPPSSSECAMLLAPSPKYVSLRPAQLAVRSASVCRSASTWHGWNSSDSALTTGTVAADGHLVRALLPEGPPDDRLDVARQDPPGVLERFVATELRAPAVDHDGVPAELGDAHLEREPGPRRVLVEDDGHATGAFEWATTEWGFLQFRGQPENLRLLVRA